MNWNSFLNIRHPYTHYILVFYMNWNFLFLITYFEFSVRVQSTVEFTNTPLQIKATKCMMWSPFSFSIAPVLIWKTCFALTCSCACSSVSMETGRTGSTDEACWDVGAFETLNPRVTRPSSARRLARGFGPQWNLRYSRWCGHCFDWRVLVTLETKRKMTFNWTTIFFLFM